MSFPLLLLAPILTGMVSSSSTEAIGRIPGQADAPIPPLAQLVKPLSAPAQRFQYFNFYNRATWLLIQAIPTRASPLNLWATHYSVHQAQNQPRGEPLLTPTGQALGPRLSRQDWCKAALEGTVQIADGQGFLTTYNYGGRGANPQVDCSPFFASLAAETLDKVNRVRFIRASAAYGYGADGFVLVPYRTIAVDRSLIPLGSVVFIPAARGTLVTLPSGDRVYHDGFFYAADVGSAIQGSHIDVFIGPSRQNPFPFVTSSSRDSFRAFLIQDPDIVQALRELHRSR
jgi:3D (Asp-Asp-Asp) domain-containing protein